MDSVEIESLLSKLLWDPRGLLCPSTFKVVLRGRHGSVFRQEYHPSGGQKAGQMGSGSLSVRPLVREPWRLPEVLDYLVLREMLVLAA